jgi:Kef-type K+ transport system membrane component KefB
VEPSIIILIAVMISIFMRLLKQPLIIGYIITGIIVSPHFLGVTSSQNAISTFAQMGVALLLFMVGLNMNPKVIREVGKVSLITGLGQVAFTSVAGFLISKLLGFSFIASLYIAVALTFSSTIIIMKLLSDRGDTETLYGRISIGFLIVQDIIAVVILMAISSLSGAENTAGRIFVYICAFHWILNNAKNFQYYCEIAGIFASILYSMGNGASFTFLLL